MRIEELKKQPAVITAPPRASAPVTECDRLAASSVDHTAVAQGVDFEHIDHVGAVPACEAAVAKYPGVARLSFQLGRSQHAKGDYERASFEYSKAIELDPKFAATYYVRGLVYSAKKDYEHAIADYSMAIELDPKFGAAYHSRGLVWEMRGDQQRAIVEYRQALAINPEDKNASAALRRLGARP